METKIKPVHQRTSIGTARGHGCAKAERSLPVLSAHLLMVFCERPLCLLSAGIVSHADDSSGPNTVMRLRGSGCSGSKQDVPKAPTRAAAPVAAAPAEAARTAAAPAAAPPAAAPPIDVKLVRVTLAGQSDSSPGCSVSIRPT